MKKRILAITLLCAFLLSGCSMLERSYVASTPHVAFSDEDNDPSILGIISKQLLRKFTT